MNRRRPGPMTDQALQVRKLWGSSVLDVRSFPPGTRRITLGDGDQPADIELPGQRLSIAPFPLLTRLTDELRLRIPPGARCLVELPDGRSLDAADPTSGLLTGLDPELPGCRCLVLPPGGRATLRFGQLGLVVGQVERPAGVVSKLLEGADGTYPNALLVTAAFCLALIATIHLRPASVSASPEQLGLVPDRYVQFLLQRTQPPASQLELAATLTGELALRARPEPAERLRGDSADDAQVAGSTGLVAVLNQAGAGLPGEAGPAVGRDLMSALGNLVGAEPGPSGGDGGWGLRGPGLGGGADGTTIGTARIRTRGRYSGQPDYGVVPSRDRPVTEREVTIDTGQLEVVGPLSMELVRAVIHRHRQQIRYCYNQALTRDARRSGKLVVRFTIGERGYVVSAQVVRSSVGDPELERCVASRVRTWKFPVPRGGGSVIVNYPFLFRASGS